jgi:hypothetical protein
MSYRKTAPKRYFVEVMAAIVLMFAAGGFRAYVTHHSANPALIAASKLLPLLPILIVAIAVWRLYLSRDEFQRHTMLKTTAAAALLSLGVFMIFPLLIQLGLPPFPPRFPLAILVMSLSYILCGLAITFVDKRAELGARRAFLALAPFLLLVLAPAAYWLATLILPLPPMTFWRGMFCFAAACICAGFWRIFVRPTEQ